MKYLPRILLVDDETDFLSVGTAILRNNGFDVYSISSGEEVFSLVKSYKPNLIVLDVKLGNHDVRIICRQLKDDPEAKAIKILLHSALPEGAKGYHSYGAEEFILKPYTIDHLVNRIKYHLK